MKKISLLFLICFIFNQISAETFSTPIDTVIVIEKKTIEIKENDNKVEVRVYEQSTYGDAKELEILYEELITPALIMSQSVKEYHKAHRKIRYRMNKKFEPHWAGFGMGFINFADANLNVNDIDGVSLNSGSSLEYNLNVYDKAFPFAKNRLAFVTGAGIRWSRYRIATNDHFEEINNITSLHEAPEGVNYNKSKLNINSFTIPFLLEWHPGKKGNFFVSAGAVGVIKFSATSKVQYINQDGKKQKDRLDRGMNIRPVTMDILAQVGYDWISAYVRYAPFELFETHKGPAVHPVAIGLQLCF